MLFRFLFILCLFNTLVANAFAQGSKVRIGIIDINANGLTDQEARDLTVAFREYFASNPNLRVLSKDEINSKLLVKNPLRQKVKALIAAEINRYADLKKEFVRAKKFYLASQFKESNALLRNIWQSLDSVALVIEPKFAEDILGYWGANEYFLGRKRLAKSYFRTLLNFSAEGLLQLKSFPPPIIDFFNEIKGQYSSPNKVILVSGNEMDFKVRFLGRSVDIQPGDRYAIRLPLDDSRLANQSLVFRKDGFAPLSYRLKEVPDQINFQSLENQSLSTKRLFGTLGSLTLSPQLSKVLNAIDADVVLLADASKDLKGAWYLKAQWLASKTDERSPLVQSEDKNEKPALTRLEKKLSLFLSKDGHLISRADLSQTLTQGSGITEGKVFYRSWWFWTLVSVGAAGAGLGTYFLVKPDDELHFLVRAGQ